MNQSFRGGVNFGEVSGKIGEIGGNVRASSGELIGRNLPKAPLLATDHSGSLSLRADLLRAVFLAPLAVELAQDDVCYGEMKVSRGKQVFAFHLDVISWDHWLYFFY